MKQLICILMLSLMMTIHCMCLADYSQDHNFEYAVLENDTIQITYCWDSSAMITIPKEINGKTVTSIGEGAFRHCRWCTEISIPDSVTSIGDCAFSSCESLMSVVIPDSVISIGDSAFSACYALKEITIPNSVTILQGNPFIGTAISVIVDSTHPTLETIDGVLFDKVNKTLISYPYGSSATQYSIPDGTQSVEAEAFFNCESLVSVSFPDSLTSIGNSAFAYCKSLATIKIPDTVTFIGDSAFERCESLISINIPNSLAC